MSVGSGMRALFASLIFLNWLAFQVHGQSGGDAVEVTTLFNLYGPRVEPWTDDKQNAVKAAIVQAAGHGVTLEQVSVSVLGTYSDQAKQSGRRLKADAQLTEPGVALKSITETTQPNAAVVSSAITSAISNGNIVNVYKASGNQDATSASVVESNTNSASKGSNSDSTMQPSDSGANNASPDSSSGSGTSSKKGFPVWAGVLVAILVLLVVAIIASYLIWRKCAARREIKEQGELQAGSFPHSMPIGKSSLVKLQPSSDPYSDAISSPASAPFDGFKGPMGIPMTSTGTERLMPPNCPSWATALSRNFKVEDSIDEERPVDNPMLGFSSTSSSVPAGASAPRNEAYMPYEPSRTGRLMNYMRGGT